MTPTLQQVSERFHPRCQVRSGAIPATLIVSFDAAAVPGTLAVFAGVLTLAGLDIHGATIRKHDDGTVHDEFEVRGHAASDVDADVLCAHVADALAGRRNLRAELAALRIDHVPADSVTEVFVDTESEITTGIRVRTPDRPGLLHDLAATLTEHGMRTRSVSILTVGGTARDMFRVVDATGAAPKDPGILAGLAAALERSAR